MQRSKFLGWIVGLSFGLAATRSQATYISLTPPSPSEYNGSSAADGNVVGARGDYITTLQSAPITSLGVEADLSGTMTVTANIYAATGYTRGALLATASTMLPDLGQTFYDVPIVYTLAANTDYDLSIAFSSYPTDLGVRLFNFDYLSGDPPFTVGSTIRVRDGEYIGNSNNGTMPNLRVNVTPEPSTLSLVAVAALGLRRRSR